MITKCKCSMSQRMVGDGCQHCNPELTIEIMQERITELELQAKRYEKLRVLNVSQFQELYLENLKGTASFDSLVDCLGD